MATRLKNIVRFVAVGAGSTVALPHLLNIDDVVAVVPDFVDPSVQGFTVTADNINVTVTNNGIVATDVDIFVEYWHSIERVFGAANQAALVPTPFVAGGSGVSGVQLWTELGIVDNLLPNAFPRLVWFSPALLVTVRRIQIQVFDPITAGSIDYFAMRAPFFGGGAPDYVVFGTLTVATQMLDLVVDVPLPPTHWYFIGLGGAANLAGGTSVGGRIIVG